MQFEQQKIIVAAKKWGTGKECTKKIAVTVGVGSGLAYYPFFGGEKEDGHILIHVPSGLGLGAEWLAETEEEAQRWIEQASTILDWTTDARGIIAQLQAMNLSGSSLKRRVEEALMRGVTPQ